MDISYFKEQIEDELCGAKDYIVLAMETKAANIAWAKQFAEMSSAELGHASALYNIFNEYYKTVTSAYTIVPDYIESAMHDITEMYSDCVPKIKIMHEMFTK